MTAPVLLWFKRDLRITDHPALAAAGAHVLPVYIIEPDYWAQPDVSARHWAFTAEALRSLQDGLGALGQPLILRWGDAVSHLAKLANAYGVTRMISHEETGNGWTYARDKRVAAWARGAGIEWVELPQSGVVRRLRGRDGWQGRRNAFMRAGLAPTPQALAPIVTQDLLERLPEPRALGLAPDPCPHRQSGSARAARTALHSFLATRGESYRTAMSSPLSAERACSRLSPYLALGVLSVREVEHVRIEARAAHGAQGQWGAALNSFAKRLAWRDHFIQKLEDEPEIEFRCLHPAHEGLRGTDAARLEAWCKGETGVPFVDACMRYLAATGWINFRMRAMLMSFASYHLWLDWRATGLHLARQFTDYEPGIHWSQVQMQSGTTGINTLRIYNPVKQGHDQDPQGRFIRAWLPELAEVPQAFLHSPWDWPEAAGRLRGYPEPIIDLAQAGKAARDRMWGLRQREGFHAVSAAIAHKHASRAGDSARSSAAATRKARRVQADPAQMSFDL